MRSGVRGRSLGAGDLQNETVQDEASRLAHFELFLGGWQRERTERDAIRRTTPHDLQALASRLFSERRQHLNVLLPEGSLSDGPRRRWRR